MKVPKNIDTPITTTTTNCTTTRPRRRVTHVRTVSGALSSFLHRRTRLLVTVTGVLALLCNVQVPQVSANSSDIIRRVNLARYNKTRIIENKKRAFMQKFAQWINLNGSQVNVTVDEVVTDPTNEVAHVVTDPRPIQLPPLFLYSQSPGKNVLQFHLSSTSSIATMANVKLYLYVWKRAESKRSNRKRRKPKKKRLIKIRVFQVDDRNRKGKRIAELRRHVEKSFWQRLSLPVSLIQSLWEANNGTLRLRVRCKRCNRKVQLILPVDLARCNKKKRRLNTQRRRGGRSQGKTKRSSRKERRRQRKRTRSQDFEDKCNYIKPGPPGHNPFMVIEKKVHDHQLALHHRGRRSADESTTAALSSPSSLPPSFASLSSSPFSSLIASSGLLSGRVRRRRRDAASSSLPASSFSPASTSLSASDPTRHAEKRSSLSQTFLTPRSRGALPYMSYRRRRSSSTSTPNTSSSSSSSSSTQPGPTRICNGSPRQSECCVVSVPVEPSEYGMGDSIVAPTTLYATSCDGSCSLPTRHHRHRHRRRGRGGGRRRKGRQMTCEATESQPLDVWFFDHNHELAHAQLPNLVVSKCGCRRQ